MSPHRFNIAPGTIAGNRQSPAPGWGVTLLLVILAFLAGWTAHALVQASVSMRP